MNEMYLLAADQSTAARTPGELALFRLDEDAAKECLRVQSADIDQDYAPLQLYSCSYALVLDHDSKTVRLASDEEGGAARTLMLVSHPFPRQAVILVNTPFQEANRSSPAGLIAPFMEILKDEPIETLTAEAQKLLREKTEQALLKKEGAGMTYEDMLELLL